MNALLSDALWVAIKWMLYTMNVLFFVAEVLTVVFVVAWTVQALARFVFGPRRRAVPVRVESWRRS